MIEKRKYLFWGILNVAGVLITLSGVLSAFLHRSPEVVAQPIPTSPELVKRVSVEEAKAAFDSGKAIFVDVRDRVAFERSHIPGALLMPLEELADRLDELNRSTWIITYCS